MSTPPPGRRWPDGLAIVALLAFALVIPAVALFGMVFAAPWFTGAASDADKIEQYVWGVVATTSAAIALVTAVVAAILGGRRARVLAWVTVPLALIGLYFFGGNTVSASHELPAASAASASDQRGGGAR